MSVNFVLMVFFGISALIFRSFATASLIITKKAGFLNVLFGFGCFVALTVFFLVTLKELM